jgi:hypothetical protein
LALNTDFVLYCEDDIKVLRIPSKKELEEIIALGIRSLCYNTHINSDLNKTPAAKLKFINEPNAYISCSDGVSRLLIKDEKVLKDEYFINFPVNLVDRQLFLNMHSHIKQHRISKGIECAITQAWFDLRYNEKYKVAIYLKEEIVFSIGSLTSLAMSNFAQMMFWSNDETLRHPSINERKNSIT